jgi:putative transposase
MDVRLKDELLSVGISSPRSLKLLEAKVLMENWRREYNTIRPHSSLGYGPPVPEMVMATTGYAHMVGGLTLRVVQ